MARKIWPAIQAANEKAVGLGISAVALVVRRPLADRNMRLTYFSLGLVAEDSERNRMVADAIKKFADDIGRGSELRLQVYVAGNTRFETELAFMLRKALDTMPKKGGRDG